ncbi:hypothetical protein L1049_014636 [Liquidambar formosana]|uniref:Disease resistance R13L4/SHOC-2-like LRR domain-containing protein n=1 Tax=Liquidambar formosana TaxID=63359 RepID=A0AAP0S325_LIQFO
MPNLIWRMEQLRHLYLPHHKRKGDGYKLRLGNLSDLQTLCGFDTRSCDVKDLIKLTNLKKLRIRMESIKELEEILISASVTLSHLRSFQSEVKSIVEEIGLQRLLLACPHLYKLALGGKIEKLPEFHQFPPNLTKLTLQGSRLEEDPMATLEKLPNLSILHLINNAFKGKEMVCSSKGFPQLNLYSLATCTTRRNGVWLKKPCPVYVN